MAITSYGYDGSVDEVAWARLHGTGGQIYGVKEAGHWKASPVAVVDRQIAISPGDGWGKGVYDSSSSEVVVGPMPAVSSGSRWDLIVARRDWDTNTTSFGYVTGSALKAIPATRAVDGGILDEQPVALVKFTAGQSQAQEIVDLRVHRGVAQDPLVLDYYNELGTQLRIKGSVWTRIVDPTSGFAAWVSDTPTTFFGAGSSIVPNMGVGPSGVQFKVQAGTNVADTDPAGYARVTFPVPFPNGLLSIVLTDGDTGIDRTTAGGEILHFGVAGSGGGSTWGIGNKTDVVYYVMRPKASGGAAAGVRHRVNWIAIGW
jgi:hypothetical protein